MSRTVSISASAAVGGIFVGFVVGVLVGPMRAPGQAERSQLRDAGVDALAEAPAVEVPDDAYTWTLITKPPKAMEGEHIKLPPSESKSYEVGHGWRCRVDDGTLARHVVCRSGDRVVQTMATCPVPTRGSATHDGYLMLQRERADTLAAAVNLRCSIDVDRYPKLVEVWQRNAHTLVDARVDEYRDLGLFVP